MSDKLTWKDHAYLLLGDLSTIALWAIPLATVIILWFLYTGF